MQECVHNMYSQLFGTTMLFCFFCWGVADSPPFPRFLRTVDFVVCLLISQNGWRSTTWSLKVPRKMGTSKYVFL